MKIKNSRLPVAPFMFVLLAVLVCAAAAYAVDQYRLTLVNEDWDVVTVQVREGDQQSCSARRFVGEKVLREGESWSGIPCGRPCWRKKLPGTGWGSWVSTSCFFRSETHHVN